MKFDDAVYRSLARLRGRSKGFDRLAVFAARHLVVVMALVAVLVYSLRGDAERTALIGDTMLSVVIAWPLSVLLELAIGRRRPYVVMKKKPVEQFWTPTPSFPSTHAAIAFAIATSILLFHPLWGAGFFLAALAVAVSRVYVGVHYLTDVVAGAIIGIGGSFLLKL